jgi:hypothetical protein
MMVAHGLPASHGSRSRLPLQHGYLLFLVCWFRENADPKADTKEYP